MLIAASLLFLSCSFQQSAVLPDTLPARRMTDLITAFNTKDPVQVERMVVRNFSKGALKALPKETWVNRIMEAAEQIAPISVESTIRSSESVLVVKLKANSPVPVGLRVDLEAETPFGIDGVRLGAPSELASSSGPKKFTKWENLNELAGQVTAEFKLPGVAIGYQQLGKNPETGVEGVRNTANPDSLIQLDDRLLVGSIGKSMTATLIGVLVDQKKLAWNSTLGAALPDIKMLDTYKSVTVDQILHHRGGLPQDLRITQDQLDRITANAEKPTDIRKAYVADVLSRQPVGPVDAQMRYSNADYVVLGYIAERITHQPYEYLMERYVFRPMGLTTAIVAPVGTEGQVGYEGEVVGHISNDFGYAPYDIGNPKLDLMMAPAGGGISCSIRDLLQFAMFHLKGITGDAKVLSEATYLKLHDAGSATGAERYACGWILDPTFAGGEPCEWHNGSNGSFYADMTIWPKSGFVAVAITNAGTTRQPSPTLQAILAIRDRLENKQ